MIIEEDEHEVETRNSEEFNDLENILSIGDEYMMNRIVLVSEPEVINEG